MCSPLPEFPAHVPHTEEEEKQRLALLVASDLSWEVCVTENGDVSDILITTLNEGKQLLLCFLFYPALIYRGQ